MHSSSRRRPAVVGIVPRYALALAVAIVVATPARATFIGAFSGNTRGKTSGAIADATINFAVLDRSGGVAGDRFGTGHAGFDLAATTRGQSSGSSFDMSASYLYLYQIVNDGTLAGAIRMTGVGFAGPLVTSFATWDLTFTDAEGVTGVDQPFGMVENPFTDPATVATDIVSPGIDDHAGRAWTGTDGFVGLSISFNPDLMVGETSALFGFTSNAPPRLVEFAGTAASVAAVLPVPIPEPSAVVLLAAGLAGLATRKMRWTQGRIPAERAGPLRCTIRS